MYPWSWRVGAWVLGWVLVLYCWKVWGTTTGHPMDPEQFSIVHKEVNNQSRTIKEAMFICVQDPTLNRNLGKYQLLHIWDHLLMESPTLQHKPSSLPTTSIPHT